MVNLEIIVLPKSEKYLEFSQSLESIKPSLLYLCNSLSITKNGENFSIIFELSSTKQLLKTLNAKELKILAGAIRLLQEESEIIVHGENYQKRTSNLANMRLNYLSKNKKVSN